MVKINNLVVAVCILAATMSTVSPVGAAQNKISGLNGTVTCQNRASAGAVVKVESSTGTFATATTNSKGHYTMYLSPGNYFAAVVSMKNCVFFMLYQPVTIYANTYTTLNFGF